jgi:hypothetical protein
VSEINEIANRTFDQIAGITRVSLSPATAQRIIDSATSGTIYIGVAGAGITTSDPKAWLVERIVVSGTTVTITHATGSWDNRASLSYS